jgi:putative N6-adenine-specific DNA methylase
VETYTLAAHCALGAEKICANEIRKLNQSAGSAEDTYTIIESNWGRVLFSTGLCGIYRALYALRTADRILLRAAAAPAPDFDALFDMARNAALEHLLPKNSAVSIGKVRTKSSALAAQTSIQSVTHKAIAENLCGAWGLRRLPDAAGAAGSFEFRVYLEKDTAELYLDICGEPLYKRGYRSIRFTEQEKPPRSATGIDFADAPLRETTAAALLLLSNWRRKYPLYDPFCGSGVIAIEAAYFACNIAPNLRRSFTLESMPIADAALAAKVRDELIAAVCPDAEFSIQGSDSNAAAVSQAKRNLNAAFEGLPLNPAGLPLFNTLEMEYAKSYRDTPGFIVTNPPWGKRQGTQQEAEENYARMSVLRDNFPGWKIAVITSHPGFESFFGRKADSCAALTNGALETFVYQFEGNTNESGVQKSKFRARMSAVARTERTPRNAAQTPPVPQPENGRRVSKKGYTW